MWATSARKRRASPARSVSSAPAGPARSSPSRQITSSPGPGASASLAPGPGGGALVGGGGPRLDAQLERLVLTAPSVDGQEAPAEPGGEGDRFALAVPEQRRDAIV